MNQHKKNVRESAADAIFTPNVELKTETNIADVNYNHSIEKKCVCYTIFGQHDALDQDDYPLVLNLQDQSAETNDLTFAKKVSVNGRNYRFYIKSSSSGKFFNPIGESEGRHGRRLRHTGDYEYKFREVNLKAFQFYTNFLKTKNLAFLRNAEREAFGG